MKDPIVKISAKEEVPNVTSILFPRETTTTNRQKIHVLYFCNNTTRWNWLKSCICQSFRTWPSGFRGGGGELNRWLRLCDAMMQYNGRVRSSWPEGQSKPGVNLFTILESVENLVKSCQMLGLHATHVAKDCPLRSLSMQLLLGTIRSSAEGKHWRGKTECDICLTILGKCNANNNLRESANRLTIPKTQIHKPWL